MGQIIPDRNRHYTVEEYFQICETSDIKYEYRDGELIPHGGWERDEDGKIIGMAGGTFEHGEIACNLIGELRSKLKGGPCRVNNSDVRVWAARSGRYVLPDVSVTCGTPVFNPPDKRLMLVNPRLVVEVLSKSTEAEDRGEKFRDYIAIDSLMEYVLVSQERPRVELFRRTADGSWAVGPWVEGIESSVTFSSLEVTLPLAEIYAGVLFPSASA
jgi:Uma2 family endonuclease